jgi:hypothetical protein
MQFVLRQRLCRYGAQLQLRLIQQLALALAHDEWPNKHTFVCFGLLRHLSL